MSEFHMAGGFFFRRNEDGTITVRVADGFDKPSHHEVTVSVEAFASAVASVSKRGETGPTWREAVEYLNSTGEGNNG